MKAADLFAGFGGFTEGAFRAGVDVIWAANHWQTAVDAHKKNHPKVEHVCQDLMQADFRRMPAYDLLLASPACQGHSEMSQPRRGPQHEAMRMTAWAVIQCLEVTRPKAVLVENIPQFLKWDLFDVWLSAFRRLGYHVTIQILLASRCGVPQRRHRAIIVGSLKREVHVRELGTPEPPSGPCLEPVNSQWRMLSIARPDAQQRMIAASKKHRHCLVQHVTGHKGIPLNEPFRTITTKRQWCEVRGDHYRWITPRECMRAMSFPDSYLLPDNISSTDAFKLVGNAIPMLMAETAVRQVAEAH
jgi:DNA (cytosine-5)-methyltransferase 1